MKMKYRLHSYLLFCVIALSYSQVSFAIKPVYSGGPERAAVRGYDVVAYFTKNAPTKGVEKYSTSHLGATWFFSSPTNKALFIANPDKYMPQFGGYCAYAVAKNSSASIKPKYFTIYENKLYLNYSKSVHKKWIKDKDGYISSAKKNWQGLLNK